MTKNPLIVTDYEADLKQQREELVKESQNPKSIGSKLFDYISRPFVGVANIVTGSIKLVLSIGQTILGGFTSLFGSGKEGFGDKMKKDGIRNVGASTSLILSGIDKVFSVFTAPIAYATSKIRGKSDPKEVAEKAIDNHTKDTEQHASNIMGLSFNKKNVDLEPKKIGSHTAKILAEKQATAAVISK